MKIFILFLHTSDSVTCISCPKIDKFHMFIIPLSLNVTLFSKSPYLTAHIKINYEAGCIRKFSEKKKQKTKIKAQRCIQDHRHSKDETLCGIS